MSQFEATLPSTDQRFVRFFVIVYYEVKKKQLVWHNFGVCLLDEVIYRQQATSQREKYAACAADWRVLSGHRLCHGHSGQI